MLVNNLPTNRNQFHNNFTINNSFGVSFNENNKTYYGLICSYRKYITGGGWKKINTWYGGYWIFTPYIYHHQYLNNVKAMVFDSSGNFYDYKNMNSVYIRNWNFIKTEFNWNSVILTNKGVTNKASKVETKGIITTNGIITKKNQLGNNYINILSFLMV